MQTTISRATTQDLAGLLAIMNHNILHSKAVYDYEPKTRTEIEQWFAEKTTAGWPVIVAKQGNEVAGYGSYGAFRFKEGFKYTVEHSVYVAEGHHGKGIGNLLMHELIRLAKQQGYHTMIGCIDAGNAGSVAFHKRFGFTEAGVLKEAGFKFGEWLDLLFMQLML
jgi:L-amino acid N-acyltransferase YncA